MQPLISTLPLMQMASGDELSLQLYRFVGESPGKKVYLQSNLHGAELAGNAVIHQLINWLSSLEPAQLQGEIWLVPVCNPLGVNTRSHSFSSGRYNPYDGHDWNRIFWDYGSEAEAEADIAAFAQSHLESDPETILQAYRQQILAAFQAKSADLAAPPSVPVHVLYSTRLQALAIDADYLIDLHTSSNRGLTYLYYFAERAAAARLFGLQFAALLDDYDGDAFDETFIKPWLALESAFKTLGRHLRFEIEAYTLELGTSMDINPVAVERGLQSIQHYLGEKGVITGVPLSRVETRELVMTRTSQFTKYFAPVGGFLQSRVEPGTWVRAGTVLYSLLCFNKSSQLPSTKPIRAEHAGLVYDVSINQAFNQGEYVLAVLQPDD
ncbi:succinylglutamate desuccinylase/aspartoacylase family protein [Pseudanabaena sp. FACHB-2040]|uniref:M14 family zinc carboxypeptidase n=1 Tax=Pseudanabaena sp. FACHB-2040 TaxID=2692859 RepID=UPI001683E770|nr:succinylglutamate desuccinylase/aspartoacylase family protein [Pseudanabaena sp. FACHB-2040]MBD2259531.1 succinylglutamate desuccinylase/aspartoacylase family protein [Pseudanabaena sp. FACHB-2040]